MIVTCSACSFGKLTGSHWTPRDAPEASRGWSLGTHLKAGSYNTPTRYLATLCQSLRPSDVDPHTLFVSLGLDPALGEAHGEQITIRCLSLRARVSARTINRQLKRAGVSFRDLVNEERFRRACRLFQRPGANVTLVAEQLGFSEVSNFSRAFRRVVGVSPSEYLRQHAGPG